MCFASRWMILVKTFLNAYVSLDMCSLIEEKMVLSVSDDFILCECFVSIK